MKKKIAKRQKIYRKNKCTSIINKIELPKKKKRIINKLNHATVELDNKTRSVHACNDNIDDNKLSVLAWHLPFLLAA